MSRRDYPVADYYQERERDSYRNGRRPTREYEDSEVGSNYGRQPAFLREDYGRSSAGPLVHRPRTTFADDFDSRSSATSRRTRDVEKDSISIRESDRRSERPRGQDYEEDDFVFRRSSSRGPRPRVVERDRPRERPREVERDEFSIRRAETDRPRTREVERDEVIIRREEDTRSRGARSVVDKEEISIKHDDSRSRRGRSRSTSRERIVIKSRSKSRGHVESEKIIFDSNDTKSRRGGSRDTSRDRITVRASSRSRGGLTREEVKIKTDDVRSRRGRDRSSSRESIKISTRSKSRGRVDEKKVEIVTDDVKSRRSRSFSRDRVTINARSSSRPREIPRGLVAREKEEFVIRRRRPPSSSPSRSPTPPPPSCRDEEVDTEEIIIRRTQTRPRTPTPPPPPPCEPEPEPVRLEPIVRPPIHQEIIQEIITHHRHIDHGFERARSPTPPPLPSPPRACTPPPKVEKLEVEITRSESRHGRRTDDEIRIERTESRARGSCEETSETIIERKDEFAVGRPRARSLSSAPSRWHHHHHDELDEEAEYYNHRAMERGYVGEAYDGATRQWGLVDIPPGTERVRMDGAGGGAQEITWQRYNGDRRSKFLTGGREYATGFGERSSERHSHSHRHRDRDMWTEVTKDLVIRDAVEAMGYDYEESEYFFYVMEYLRYEDVLQLVELSDNIRRQRRHRSRGIEWTDDRSRRSHDDRTSEREVLIERERRR